LREFEFFSTTVESWRVKVLETIGVDVVGRVHSGKIALCKFIKITQILYFPQIINAHLILSLIPGKLKIKIYIFSKIL